MHYLRLILVSAALVSTPFAQDQVQRQERITPTDAPNRSKLTKQQQAQVRQLLESAEAGAAALDAASRIVAYADLARAYQDADKSKAISLLESALAACRDLQLESADKTLNNMIQRQLQSRIVRDLAALAPEKLDLLMDQLTPDMRASALEPMVNYYVKANRIDRATEIVTYVAQESEMPYMSAITLMSQFGHDRTDELRSLFVSSLTSYQSHQHTSTFRSNGDFPDMVTKFQDQLPPALLQQAVDEILSQAKTADEKFGGMTISVASSQGAASFQSAYDFRLFQLAPVLKRIDAERAERLLKERQDVSTLASKYPEAMNSLNSNGPTGGNMSMMVSMGGGPPSSQGESQKPTALERQRAAQIVEDSAKHPQEALANAAMLSAPIALDTYLAIARAAQKHNPSDALAALDKAMPLIPKVALEEQMRRGQQITSLYLQLGDTDKAKNSLEQSLAVADRLYKKDSNADDPNRAPKGYWASTDGYRVILMNAQQIDPAWATTLLKEIPDDGIRVFNEIAMANAISGKPTSGSQIMSSFKNGGVSTHTESAK